MEKILVVDSSTENCDISMSVAEGDLFEYAEADFENYYGGRIKDSVTDVFKKLKSDGKYTDPDEENGDPILLYWKNGSVFKTDMIQIKYWAPDDILERFTIAYIAMP